MSAALSVYPIQRGPFGLAGGVALFLDPGCTQRAALFDLNGKPLPGNVLNVSGPNLPEFQSPAPVLYVRSDTGDVVALSPHAQRSAIAVSGSKSANAALTSLLAALSQLGIVSDQTT